METYLKHIKLFEELSNTQKSIILPLFGLKEAAEKAASFDDAADSIRFIQSYLKNNEMPISNALSFISSVNREYGLKPVNIFHFMEPLGKALETNLLMKDLDPKDLLDDDFLEDDIKRDDQDFSDINDIDDSEIEY